MVTAYSILYDCRKLVGKLCLIVQARGLQNPVQCITQQNHAFMTNPRVKMNKKKALRQTPMTLS